MATEPRAKKDIEFLWKWRKYLMLLATLVAGVTYAAEINPPGGVRSEDGEHPPLPAAVYRNRVGDPVLVSTYLCRYTAFSYCNAAAFVASLVIIMLLLDRRISDNRVGLTVLRSAMLLDLLALMAAFAAGSSRDVVASMFVSAIFALVLTYVAIQVYVERRLKEPAPPRVEEEEEEEHKRLKERCKLQLLLATFATPLTYAAGLAPPGGFWSQTVGGHLAGAPLLHDGPYKIRYHIFFYSNAISFVASLTIIMMVMSRTRALSRSYSYALPVCLLMELFGLMGAYAAGGCRFINTTVYIVSRICAVLLYIVLQVVVAIFVMGTNKQWGKYVCGIMKLRGRERRPADSPPGDANPPQREGADAADNGQQEDKVEESRSLVLLLATLAAAVTYQSGLSPPGGVWPEGDLNHTPGSPVLHDIHPKRYKAFYYCNTAAFVVSVVVIIVVQSKQLSSSVGRAALKTAMLLNLFGLMGAYVAGSCRDATTTIYVSALAVAVFVVYSIAKVVACTADGEQSRPTRWVQRMFNKLEVLLHQESPRQGGAAQVVEEKNLKRKRRFLLQLAILAATLTYQTGLNPPGGFWPESKGARSLTAGDPVLLDHYGIRYQVFFYCNTTGFMASVAVILMLVNPRQGTRSNALHVCVMLGLLGLMGAYAAGSCQQLRASIYVFALVAAVVAFLVLQILFFVSADRRHFSELPWLPQWLKGLLKPLSSASMGPDGENEGNEVSAPMRQQRKRRWEKYAKRKSRLLLGILVASVTYQAGLTPPGGTWGDESSTSPSPSPSPSSSPSAANLSFVAGDPILLATNPTRYLAFFYCNATSFIASIFVIMLLLQHSLKPRSSPLMAMQTTMVMDLLGLLGAYVAGSCRDSKTSVHVIALAAAVVVFITIYVLLSFHAVLGKAKELKVWKCLGGSHDNDQSAATVAVTSV